MSWPLWVVIGLAALEGCYMLGAILWRVVALPLLKRWLDICSPSLRFLGMCPCSRCKRWRSGDPHGIKVRLVREGPARLELPP